jgi:hypothetical protein
MMFKHDQIASEQVQLRAINRRADKYGASHVFATLKRLELEESLRCC